MLAIDPLAQGAASAFDGLRPLKRWRYVGVFCEQLFACAAVVRIGPLRQSFWSLHVRGTGLQRGRTRLLPRAHEVQAQPDSGRLLVRDRGVELSLRLHEDGGWQALCPHGRSRVWTRKQAGVPAHGTLRIDGGPAQRVQARAVIDDTAGYHARETEWWWSAGVGEAADGTALAWNLVSGVNDPPVGSERAVWVAGAPSEAPPVRFESDLATLRCEDGSELRFSAESERRRRDELLIVASDYVARFGAFTGELPGGIALAQGFGVVERHRARW